MAQFYKNFKSIFSGNNPDNGIITFCKTEYGSDWYWAYASFKNEGRFPSVLRGKY